MISDQKVRWKNVKKWAIFKMKLIKIATAGSVDDGKSTLIGRLLFETNSLKKDQVEHIKSKSQNKGYDYMDLSLATDGLLTEREQGITIDVSHIFFSTSQRRFIIADSPGHIEYTRNMVTGASTSHAAIVLLDARKGVIEQTKRHYYLTRLLGIKQLVFAINKMDLVHYSEEKFNEIVTALHKLILHNSETVVYFVPVSALKGENIVTPSAHMKWYKGITLLTILEQLSPEKPVMKDAVFQVQYVLRPKTDKFHDYRGFAGKMKSGSLRSGDAINILPSGQSSYIKAIEQYGTKVEQLTQGESGTIILIDEIDISRGNCIIAANSQVETGKHLVASVCWMQNTPLKSSSKYWIQQGVQRTLVKISTIHNKLNLDTLFEESSTSLELNDIGKVSLITAHPIVSKPFQENNALGSFIFIDAHTHNTAGVGFITSL